MFLNFIILFFIGETIELTKLNTFNSLILGREPKFLFEAYSIKLTGDLNRRIGINLGVC